MSEFRIPFVDNGTFGKKTFFWVFGKLKLIKEIFDNSI